MEICPKFGSETPYLGGCGWCRFEELQQTPPEPFDLGGVASEPITPEKDSEITNEFNT